MQLKVWLAPKHVAGLAVNLVIQPCFGEVFPDLPGRRDSGLRRLQAQNQLWPHGLREALLCNAELFPRVSTFPVPVSSRCFKPCFTRQRGSCCKIMSLIRVGQILQTVVICCHLDDIDSKQLNWTGQAVGSRPTWISALNRIENHWKILNIVEDKSSPLPTLFGKT